MSTLQSARTYCKTKQEDQLPKVKEVWRWVKLLVKSYIELLNMLRNNEGDIKETHVEQSHTK